jgi:SNF2 family DNA or RNA helicase
MIIRLNCQSTVEETIYKRAEHKLKLANDIIETGLLANDLDLLKLTSSTIQNELCVILKYGIEIIQKKTILMKKMIKN